LKKKPLRSFLALPIMGFSTTLYHFYPLSSHTVSGFLGRYDFQMDEKGRVSLPAAFRREAGGERFVLLQWEKPYLTLFPEEVWTSVQERLLEYRRADPEAWGYVREITSNAVEVSPDKQGRILLPPKLREYAGIGQEAVMVGIMEHIEIWNPETMDRYLEEGREDIAQITETFSTLLFSAPGDPDPGRYGG